MVSSDFVYIGFGSEGNFSFTWSDWGSFFASLLASGRLAGSCLLKGCSGELLVLHDLRSYVISRGDGGREDFNTWKKIDNASEGNFEGRLLR